MRICIYTKRLTRAPDEGVARVAHELGNQLVKHFQVLMVGSTGDIEEKEGIRKVPSNPFFLNPGLRREIRSFRPDVMIYIPTASACLFNFCRLRILKKYGTAKAAVMLVLQPNNFNRVSWRFAPLVKPDLVLAPSTKTCRELAKMGCKGEFVPLGVDLRRFIPAAPEGKRELRHKYRLDSDAVVALHVGHINRNRNIQLLSTIQNMGVQVIIVGSTSTKKDITLLQELQSIGAKVLTDYIEAIEEVYQLSDFYIFPTLSETGCIGIPLSILEAMACNLPVITTKIGGLPDLFSNGETKGFLYAETEVEIVDRALNVKDNLRGINIYTREMVVPYSWENCGQELANLLYRFENNRMGEQ
jgi:glycosyltransferase involved in cell wall biosynthesis